MPARLLPCEPSPREPMKVTDEGWRLIYDYGAVPWDFMPAFPAEAGDTRRVLLRMHKTKPGDLTGMIRHGFGWSSLLYGPTDFQHRQKDLELIQEDVKAAATSRARILACNFQGGGGRRYWYGAQPAGMDADRLRSRVRDHPMIFLAQRPAHSTCPLTEGESEASR